MRIRFVLALLAACGSAVAEVWMPAIFGDNMVLQQGRNIPVWGKAAPGEKVSVWLGGKTAEATAGGDGKWMVMVEPLPAGGGQLEMRVSGSNTLIFRNVLAGDVWVCSGQSNMEWPLSASTGGTEEAQQADFPEIRFFTVARRPTFERADEVKGKWMVCTPKEALSFSAVAYYFGREIQAARKMPVGLISSSVGGTPAQSWTSAEKLAKYPALKPYADEFYETRERLPELMTKYETEDLPRFKEEMEKWKASPQPRGPRPDHPTAPLVPAGLFNGMIHPLMPYAITGVIWYQGEANAARPAEYAELFPALIQDWRERWGQGDFPFLFVQLAGLQKPGWVELRQSQTKALDLPATAMAVTIDVGDEKNIHPKDKRTVGRRLAQAARHMAYGEKVEYSGPVFTGAKPADDTLLVTFDHVGGGLMAGTPAGEAATELQGFEVAGTDGQFFPAAARIDSGTVVVSSDKVAQPTYVRYAWAAWPVPMANLYNKDGLPAVPFNSRPVPLTPP